MHPPSCAPSVGAGAIGGAGAASGAAAPWPSSASAVKRRRADGEVPRPPPSIRILRAALLGHVRLGESFEEISRLRIAVAQALAVHIEDFVGVEDLPAGRSWSIS
eukprot:9006179-Alexandrium_andersonii.AAC.1